ncbi:MAG: ABC transporter permease [Nitrospiraceae bacterium]|nr:ABC transporter permease [Nitrospiraceae bacterium]
MTQAIYTDRQQRQFGRIVPDLVRYRGLLRDVVWRELRARYRNAMIGFLWAVVQPVSMMLILTLVFGFLLGDLMGDRAFGYDRSFAVCLLCGLVPWQFLAAALASGTNSLIDSQDLIKKVHFPREIVPLAAVINCLVNAAIGFITLLVVMVIMEGVSSLGVGLLYTPFIFAIQFTLIVGLVLLLSSLNVHYRDVGYLVEVALAFGFYASPIFYPLPKGMASLPFPEAAKAGLYQLYMLNPMTNLIAAYRQALLGNQVPDFALLARPALFAVIFLFLGAYVFRRQAPTFADHL